MLIDDNEPTPRARARTLDDIGSELEGVFTMLVVISEELGAIRRLLEARRPNA